MNNANPALSWALRANICVASRMILQIRTLQRAGLLKMVLNYHRTLVIAHGLECWLVDHNYWKPQHDQPIREQEPTLGPATSSLLRPSPN